MGGNGVGRVADRRRVVVEIELGHIREPELGHRHLRAGDEGADAVGDLLRR